MLAAEDETESTGVGSSVKDSIVEQDDRGGAAVGPIRGCRDQVAFGSECVEDGLGDAAFNTETAGDEFVLGEAGIEVFGLEARGFDGFLGGHAEIDDID